MGSQNSKAHRPVVWGQILVKSVPLYPSPLQTRTAFRGLSIRPCGRQTEVSGFTVRVIDVFGRRTIVFVFLRTEVDGGRVD